MAAVPARRPRPVTVAERVTGLRAMAATVAATAAESGYPFAADFADAVDVFLAELDPQALLVLDPARNQRIN